MKKDIFLRIFITCAVVILLVCAVMAGMFAVTKERDIVDNMRESLGIMIGACDTTADGETLAARMKELSGSRITIVGPDGTVLGDSDENAQALENHGGREEIKEAKTKGIGVAKRRSDTFLTRMVYVAVKSGDNIYRMARTNGEVTQTLLGLWPMALVAVGVALAVALLLSRYAANRAMRPLLETVDAVTVQMNPTGDRIGTVDTSSLEEISPLIRTIDEMNEDITRARNKLSTQRDQNRFILDSMEQGLIFVDPGMKVILVNVSARSFLGEQGEAEGLDFIHLTREMKLYDSVSLAVKEGRSCIFDLDLRRTAGAIVEVRVSPVRESWIGGGKAERRGAVVVLTDVTQSRQMDEMRREFVANASHELKTPITSIKGFAELLAAGLVRDDRKAHEYLLRIRDESQRMTSIIEDILKLSSLEAEEYHPPRSQVDLIDVSKEAAEHMAPEAEKAQVAVTVEGENITLTACREDIYQMISNLMDNAIKYNRPGGYVKVRVHRVGDKAKIVVEDNGIGIAPEHQGRIFERFYRVDKGRSRKVGGTGLGLSIVKHVAASLGGEISVRSREGKGTTITITLPQPPPTGGGEIAL
ncbi:sensor histidine kinase [Zongyangia hominis]|uniref:histidine kinase n=1 Tax=Zongyangia hominis TaxID=2763677 RepID=A0A926EEF6_9FIRM|nr:ATP-binding protein [Zongyangia hominis]MBC8570669.1 hypothetical protein [Zongyangia hominis]